MIRAAQEASYQLDTELRKVGDVPAPAEAVRNTDNPDSASKGDGLRSRTEDLAKAAHIFRSAEASHGGEDEMLDSIATKTHLAGLAAHLTALPPRSRALVHELYVVGSTAAIAADRLGISRATLHRNHAELRAEVARLLDPNKASSATARTPFDAK
jgi:DNA-directed RNA polymerase specialized sigma24 family protein